MAVFRIEKTHDYTVMSNHHLRNVGLSLKSKGLLSMMLSLPEDWNYPCSPKAKGHGALRGCCPAPGGVKAQCEPCRDHSKRRWVPYDG